MQNSIKIDIWNFIMNYIKELGFQEEEAKRTTSSIFFSFKKSFSNAEVYVDSTHRPDEKDGGQFVPVAATVFVYTHSTHPEFASDIIYQEKLLTSPDDVKKKIDNAISIAQSQPPIEKSNLKLGNKHTFY